MDRYNIKARQLSVSWLMENLKKKPDEYGKLFFDMNSQREENQWNVKWKSDLVHSLIQGYFVPEVHIVQDGTSYIKSMSVFEGKQRITSVREYVLNLYPLAKTTLPVTIKSKKLDEFGNEMRDEKGHLIVKEEVCEIAGKRYRELPQKVRDMLMEAEFTAQMYFDFTDEEIAVQMERLNRQKGYNGTQKAKVAIGELTSKMINNIKRNDFFEKRIVLTKAGKKADELSKIIFQSLMVYIGNVTALTNSNIEKFAKTHPECFDRKTLSKINDILTDLNTLIPNNSDINQHLTSVNIPILVFNYDKYEQMLENEEITREEYMRFLKYWFKEGIISDGYTQYIGNTPASKTFVEGRINVMEDELVNFIAGLRNTDKSETAEDNKNIENTAAENKDETSNNDINKNKSDSSENADTDTETGKGNNKGNDAKANINDKYNIKEQKSYESIKNYLKHTAKENLSKEKALMILKSEAELNGYVPDGIKGLKHFIRYMNNLTGNKRKELIEQGISLISEIDFKITDDIAIPEIIKLYREIKTNDNPSGKIKFNQWLKKLRTDLKYQDMISKLDYSEKSQSKCYSYLYDDFWRYITDNHDENTDKMCG